MPRPPCDHRNFNADVTVNRLEDVGLNYADLTIRCASCGAPAVFRGLKLGLSPNEPRANPGNQEVRLPFTCEGDPEPKPSAGFDVHGVMRGAN
jgi:hypothetical protein